MKRLPETILMWTVVIRSKRSSWIYTDVIARTRRIAFNTYCDLQQLHHETQEQARIRIRLEMRRGEAHLSKVWVGVPGKVYPV